jgi:hypothetical protein
MIVFLFRNAEIGVKQELIYGVHRSVQESDPFSALLLRLLGNIVSSELLVLLSNL